MMNRDKILTRITVALPVAMWAAWLYIWIDDELTLGEALSHNTSLLALAVASTFAAVWLLSRNKP